MKWFLAFALFAELCAAVKGHVVDEDPARLVNGASLLLEERLKRVLENFLSAIYQILQNLEASGSHLALAKLSDFVDLHKTAASGVPVQSDVSDILTKAGQLLGGVTALVKNKVNDLKTSMLSLLEKLKSLGLKIVKLGFIKDPLEKMLKKVKTAIGSQAASSDSTLTDLALNGAADLANLDADVFADGHVTTDVAQQIHPYLVKLFQSHIQKLKELAELAGRVLTTYITELWGKLQSPLTQRLLAELQNLENQGQQLVLKGITSLVDLKAQVQQLAKNTDPKAVLAPPRFLRTY